MDNSPLSKLPAELRNQIWMYTLSSSGQLYASKDVHDVRNYTTKRRHMLAITATCKDIRNETRLMFYAVNTFTLTCFGWEQTLVTRLDDLLSLIGSEGAGAMRDLVIKKPISPGFGGSRRENCHRVSDVLDLLKALERFALNHTNCKVTAIFDVTNLMQGRVYTFVRLHKRAVSESWARSLGIVRGDNDHPKEVVACKRFVDTLEMWKFALEQIA